MTAGAAQTVLKAQGLLPDGRTVMAGTGPLMWLLAAQILRAGGKIAAILDTTPRRKLLRAAPASGRTSCCRRTSPRAWRCCARCRRRCRSVGWRASRPSATASSARSSPTAAACRPICCCCTRASCPTSTSPSLSARRMNGTSVSSASSPCSTRIRQLGARHRRGRRRRGHCRRHGSGRARTPCRHRRGARAQARRPAARSAKRAPAPAARGDGPRLPRLAEPSGRLLPPARGRHAGLPLRGGDGERRSGRPPTWAAKGPTR